MKTRNLTLSELQKANIERCTAGFGHELDGWSVAEWGCAAVGELGEACNIAKKMLRLRDGIKGNDPRMTRSTLRADLAREMADTVIYLSLWAASQNIDLEEAVISAFNNKSIEIGSDIML